MLLAAYEGTISRLETAQSLIEQGEETRAQPLLLTAQRLILEEDVDRCTAMAADWGRPRHDVSL